MNIHRCCVLLPWLMVVLAMAPAQEPAGKEARGVKTSPDKVGQAAPDPASTKLRFGRYRALLIGIENYANFPKLATPLNDLQAIEKLLRERYGFSEITVLRNAEASRRGILGALSKYNKLGKEDNLLIYYAGHGYLNPETKEGFWIPPEAAQDELEWVSNDDIKKMVARIGAKHTLLVSDSCFSGSLTRGGDLAKPERYIERVSQLDSYQVISSGGQEEVSDSGHDGLSKFAYYFTLALKKNEEPFVAARDLFDALVRMVANDSDQVPEMGRIAGAKDERGEFVFEMIAASAGDTTKVGRGPTGVPAGWSLPRGVVETLRGDGTFDYRSTERDETEMVMVLPGKFPFGALTKEVEIATPFLIDLHEVTVARFRQFLKSEPMEDLPYWNAPGYEKDEHPMVGVDLQTAMAFARWAGKQLPDEV